MASLGTAAKGTLLIWNEYPVLELTNVSSAIGDMDLVDITNHDSANDTEEVVPGLIRGGEFSVEGNLLPGDTTGQVAILGDLQSRTARAARICLPAGTFNMEFTARAKTFKPTAPVGGKMGFTATFKPTTKSTIRTTVSTGLTTPFFALRDNGANAVTPSPSASGTVYQYDATLDAADTAIAIQPTASAGTIKVNGETVVSGAWSSDISVASGTTKLVVVEVRETNKTSKIYRIHVTRPST